MNKLLLKANIKETIANSGGVIIDYIDKVIALWIEEQQKNSATYYSVIYTDNDAIGEYKLLVHLSMEQVEEIKQASVIDGEEYDYDEVLDQFAESFLQAEGPGYALTPTHIDLNRTYYLYGVDIAVFRDGINNAPEIIKRRVELNAEEYAWLLRRYIIYPYTSFNEIRCLNNNLFNKICGCIEANIENGVVQLILPTYTAELTQIKQHAAELEQMINEIKENK